MQLCGDSCHGESDLTTLTSRVQTAANVKFPRADEVLELAANFVTILQCLDGRPSESGQTSGCSRNPTAHLSVLNTHTIGTRAGKALRVLASTKDTSPLPVGAPACPSSCSPWDAAHP